MGDVFVAWLSALTDMKQPHGVSYGDQISTSA
jgi:hypothetical protein